MPVVSQHQAGLMGLIASGRKPTRSKGKRRGKRKLPSRAVAREMLEKSRGIKFSRLPKRSRRRAARRS